MKGNSNIQTEYQRTSSRTKNRKPALPTIQNHTKFSNTVNTFETNLTTSPNMITEHSVNVRDLVTPSMVSPIGFLEIFNHSHLKDLKEKIDKLPEKKREARKYDGKIELPIVESIIYEGDQPSYWLFTDLNGYVMRRSSKKLNKDYIINYFIRSLINFSLNTSEIKIEQDKRQIEVDLTNYCIITAQKYDISKSEGLKYLDHLVTKKFIFVQTTTDEKILNILELNRELSDSTKIPLIKLIQNFININKTYKPILCKYSRKDALSSKQFLVFTVKPKNRGDTMFPDESNVRKIWNKKLRTQGIYLNSQIDSESEKEREKDFLQDLIKLHDANLTLQVEKISNEFIKFYEKMEKVDIFYFLLNFFKTNDGRLVFSGADKIMYKKRKPESVKPINLLTEESKKPFSRSNKKIECYGDFCTFEIPKYYKNLKKIDKFEDKIDYNAKIKSKTFNERKLPNVIPIVTIKKVYDNPVLVDLVLRAYNIYPKNFERDEFVDKEIKAYSNLIFKPLPGKFKNINLDSIYSDKNVCNNCYLVYVLISNFLTNIDENNSCCNLLFILTFYI